MNSDLQTIQVEDMFIRVKQPQGDGPHPVLLLLHGWTGDENVMWVFTGKLPQHYLMLAPRALYPAPGGGFSWHPEQAHSRPWVDDFRPAVDRLLQLLTPEYFPQAEFKELSLIGFSQGAALAYSFSLLHPARVTGLAGLSGFMPEGAEALARNQPLKGKPAFVAHGTEDETVRVERARQAVQVLEEAGARVTYCEDEVGHKLSANCFRSLETFFAA
jgi:phospholipase/carboxylesterase